MLFLRYTIYLLVGVLLIIAPAYGLLPPVFVSDVTPTSFTLNSRLKELSPSDISVFIGSEAETDITEKLRLTPYPLHAHTDSIHSAWETRQEKESLRQRMQSLHISQVAVSGCMPSSTYYVTISSDQQIYSVTTALYNRFIYHAPQLIVHFPKSHASFNPNGFLILAQSPLAIYPVSAIVGDGIPERAIVNLSNLFDAEGLNLNTDLGVDIQVTAQGEQLTPVIQDIHLEPSDTFDVASSYSMLINKPPTFTPVASQQLTEDQLHQINLKINDLETAAGHFTITAQSSNIELIPNENIEITYTGKDYTVSIEPARFQSGTAAITLTISDSYDVTWTAFQVDVEPVANTPIFGGISPINGSEDSSVVLSFFIGLIDKDGSEVLENICLKGLPPGGSISFPAIFEAPCWTLENTDEPFLYYYPPPNDHTDFDLIVSYQSRELENNDIARATTSIEIIMEPVNDPPVISGIADMVMNENTISQPIAFTVSDIDHPANQLQVSVSSDTQTLFPQSSFSIEGTENKRYLTIQPAPNQSGKGEIIISVSDGEISAERRFMINVLKQQPAIMGDFSGDGTLSLDDLIIVLQAISNMDPPISRLSAAIDSEHILLEDALYIIFKISGIVYHSGDYNPPDLKININEMLRLIQLHNADGYHCDSSTEDGYALEKSDALNACPFHSSDFAHDNLISDWAIDDFELNRFIDFYNADAYVPDKHSIDGFRPK